MESNLELILKAIQAYADLSLEDKKIILKLFNNDMEAKLYEKYE